MRRFFGKKAAIVGVMAVAIIALSAANAFAAPVLQPGTTSAPGMSGTCTDCHTYAKPASAPKPAAPKPAVLLPSHPYLASSRCTLGQSFDVWGFIPPKLAKTADDTLTISVQRYTHKKWTAVTSLDQTATLSMSGKFKNKTNYSLSLTLNRGGSYRMQATLVYKDAKGVVRTKRSAFKKFSVKK